MAHHHKSNSSIEGRSDSGRGRGMPERPDEKGLEERTEEERREAGLPAEPGASSRAADPEAQYEDERAEIDRQVKRGEMHTDARSRMGSRSPRKDREPFPPTHYDD